TTPARPPVGCPPAWSRACPRRGQEPLGLPQCCALALPACRGLRTPADLHRLAVLGGPGLPAGACQPSASATRLCDAVPALQGARSPRRPTGDAVDASPILFVGRDRPTPPGTQDALRVGGSP